jgi:hypothetical protein
MRRNVLVAVVCVALALSFARIHAQGKPTEADLTLRPNDTVAWIPAPGSPHKVQFGGTVTATVGGQPTQLTLTAPSDIEKIFTDFNPPLPPKPASGPDVRVFAAGQKVTAKVKADAVPQFFFTCGAHPNQMVTVPFLIKPADASKPQRAVQIVSDPSLQWLLNMDDGTKKTLNRNKQ